MENLKSCEFNNLYSNMNFVHMGNCNKTFRNLKFIKKSDRKVKGNFK